MIWNAFLLALREIRRSAMRSILTTLGIVIGVASVIAMVMLGDATTAYVSNSISKLGTNMLILRPGQDRRGPRSEDTTAKRFSHDDLQAIHREITDIRGAAPIGSKGVQAVYGNQNYSTTIDGSDNDYFTVKDWVFESGRMFAPAELQGGKAVCVIGETVRKELFADQDPLGASIRLGTFSCQVIGLLKPKGASMFGMDQDDIIIVPIRLLQRRGSGNQEISMILVSASSPAVIENVKDSLHALFQERRRIKLGEEDDFSVRDMREMVQTLTSTTKMLTLLLGAVATISLLVGGIGIMNIMLVSVTERTREIGLRKAIGARRVDIITQFLIEAVLITVIGGFIGIIFGIGTAALLSVFAGWATKISPISIIMATTFSISIG